MTEAAEGGVWPLPKISFRVAIPGIAEMVCQEVSGLDVEAQPIEYRSGESKSFSTIKMPGIVKYGNVTLKKVTLADASRLWAWLKAVEMNSIQRETALVSLLDQNGATTMVWKLTNAWPTKVSGADLRSGGDEVAFDTMEIAHEGLTIESGS